MKNITVAISDQAYHDARVWAAEHRTSLSKTVALILGNLRKIPMASSAFPLPKPSPAKSTESARP